MDKLIFVTGNVNKGHEIEERFGIEQIPIEIVQFDFNEPEVNDIVTVSKSKAIQAYQALGKPCFVIDSGFNIYDYPNNPGYPGAFVRRSGISEDIDGLLDTLKNVKNRTCQFLDCLTFYDGIEFHFFYGKDEGVLTYEKRGMPSKAMRSSLWYVFIPNDSTKTLAEMTDEERINRKDGHISAKEQFIEWYKNNYMRAKVLTKDYSNNKWFI